MAQRYQLPRSGSRINGLLGPLGAVGGTSGPDELNRFGLEAASVWASVGAAATEAVGVFAAPGGRSRPPLRPQPASASTAMPRRMTAHPEDLGHRLRFTIESPQYGWHHTNIGLLWRVPENHAIATKLTRSARFLLFFEPLGPAFRLRAHVFRSSPAKTRPAFDRSFDRQRGKRIGGDFGLDLLHGGQRQFMQRHPVLRRPGDDSSGDMMGIAERHFQRPYQPIGKIGRGGVAVAGGGLHPRLVGHEINHHPGHGSDRKRQRREGFHRALLV